MLVASSANGLVEAFRGLDRDAGYECPACNDPVILKAGRVKAPHFAHKPGPLCSYGSGETNEHRLVKRWVTDYLRSQGWEAEPEKKLDVQLHGKSFRRADVWASRDGVYLAVEVQFSPMDLDALYRRTRAYRSLGAGTVWIFKAPNGSCLMDEVAKFGSTPVLRAIYSDTKSPDGAYARFVDMENCALFSASLSPHWLTNHGGEYGDTCYPTYDYKSKRWVTLDVEDVTWMEGAPERAAFP